MEQDDENIRTSIALQAAKEGARLAIESYKHQVKSLCSDFRAEMATVNGQYKTKILLARTKQEGQTLQQLGQLLLRDAATSKKLERAMMAMGTIALDETFAVIENELIVKPEHKN